jgi:hypothetical protein
MSGKAVKTARKRVPAAKKKAPTKKASAKKAATKKAPGKEAATKKPPAKKAPAKKAPAKKAPAKKAPARKAPARKAPARKAPAKKVPAKKAPAKNAAEKKAAPKKAPPKKASAESGSARKRPSKTAKPGAVATEKRRVLGGATGGSAAVDAYVERLEAWQREVIQRVRRLVREMAPEAAESIKWGQPVFERGGPFAYVRPAGSHVTFGFWRGAELDDPSGVLEGAGDRMRHVKLHEAAEIDEETLGAFVRHAVALNHRHGNPAAIRRV